MDIYNFVKENGKVGCCGCCDSEHDISDLLVEAYELGTNEDYAMLARENKAMAEKLLELGFTDDQVSDIANGKE